MFRTYTEDVACSACQHFGGNRAGLKPQNPSHLEMFFDLKFLPKSMGRTGDRTGNYPLLKQ